ncbi:Sensor histidine kinase RcsC [Sporomusa carbonis]|uniref:ATP-binding protein n=1 Tax=Sporomusa carbonis TaxID=3076075 RepID=UPI003A70E712
MKNLSIKLHLWIAFVVMAMIPVVFISIFQIRQIYEIIVMFLLILLLGYIHAMRINSTIRILVEYIQKVIGEGYAAQPVNFPKFAPSEFQFMAKNFFDMAKTIREGQQALLELNTELEQRVEERTKSLLRINRELAILNQLITPITPYPGGAKVIGRCLRQFFEVSGVKVKMYLTKPVFSLLGPYEDVPGNDDYDHDAVRENAHRYYVKPIRSGKTTFGHFVVSNSPLTEADRRFLEMLSHSAGIIFQNEILSRTLQQNHAVVKAVLESMYDAITIIDNKREVVYVNGRMAEMLGTSREKLRGLSEDLLFDAVSGILLNADKEFIKQIRQEYGAYKLKIRLANNQERFKVLSAFPVTDDKNNTIGKGYLWRDITKEQEVDRLKSDLISLVSHEFKTPITSIKGSVETLLRHDTHWDEEFKRELLTGIHEDIERIKELVNDWLDLSRIDAKAIGLKREPLRPSIVVDSAIRKLPKHFGNGVIIESTVNENLPLIFGDRVRLEQVVANLLTNAIRYNDRTPHIKITADIDEKYVHIAVEDNGIGISAEHLDKVFDRFYCVDAGWVRRTGGTGLGLAICKGIIEAHGGSIRAESIEGNGSVFTVSIPRYKYVGDKYEKI